MNKEHANTKEGIDINDLKDTIKELDAKISKVARNFKEMDANHWKIKENLS